MRRFFCFLRWTLDALGTVHLSFSPKGQKNKQPYFTELQLNQKIRLIFAELSGA
jgi:hypothetical protein